MITELLFILLYTFLYAITAVFRLAPDVSLSSTFLDSVVSARDAVVSIDRYFPVHELITILLTVFIVYEVALFTYKLIMWVVKKIPGIS